MKLVVGRDGVRRLWYTRYEIETICVGRLRDGRLWPSADDCATDVESLLENELGALVDYNATMPSEVLGYTVFLTPPRVSINRDASEAAWASGAPMSAIGRWRATLAHEAAHIILHGPLYAEDPLLLGRRRAQPIRCARTTVDQATVSDWREVQANMGMAALLMPTELFTREAVRALARRSLELPPLDLTQRELAGVLAYLSARFRVSQRAAEIRLRDSGYV